MSEMGIRGSGGGLMRRTECDGQERGLSLIVVMMILIVVSVLGVGGIQIAMMAERGTRNDRDMQIAWQAAEAALIDAEYDIEGQPASATNKRNVIFERGGVKLDQFISGCNNSDSNKNNGLCKPELNSDGKPAWLAVDFSADKDSDVDAKTVEFGKYTGRGFPSGPKGIQSAKKPRYVIEALLDSHGANSFRTTDPNGPEGNGSSYVYRITAMGFGPNKETQSVLQVIYRN